MLPVTHLDWEEGIGLRSRHHKLCAAGAVGGINVLDGPHQAAAPHVHPPVAVDLGAQQGMG